ncbi:radical SAM protein [Pseudanabaena sp. PCC 6802]|uniref:radical SAM protein n=1 Tax=Pseudanabaena sp. PCC 6802 TaxID=118173 RepID=UPI00034BE9D4|nr:radical SAM protein [Pseudanabaena sp. PCC 6802]
MKSQKRLVQFVVKTSKFCNLRCRYCYEYSELGNKAAIDLEQLEQMYRHIYDYYRRLDCPTQIDFVWHGGEPLLNSPDFYWKTFDLQKKIFGELSDSISNAVQTNLTVLNKERVRLLRDGFDSVGVSVDLFGGLRVNQTGVDSLPTVLANMDRLHEENIRFGCITVLTKLNLPHLREIYKFYEKMNLSCRILPLFKGSFDGQHDGFEISHHEILNAFCTLVDLWLESERTVMMIPIVEHIEQILHYYSPNSKPFFYDKHEWESVFLVNTNGEVYSYTDAYSGLSHGNIFTTSLESLIKGASHHEVIAAAEERMAATCSTCPFFGSCTGYPVAEGSKEYNELDERGVIRCIVTKGVLQHVEYRLKQAGIINPATGELNLNRLPLSEMPAALRSPI